MAPSAVETTTETTPQSTFKLHLGQYKEIEATRVDRETEEGKRGEPAAKVTALASIQSSHDADRLRQYPHYLPTWNPEQQYPALEPFEHVEHGKDADNSFTNLLPTGTQVTDLTPTIGTEVRGVQLSTLSSAGKDELARFVAERKVVAFRGQDFADLSIQEALDFGGYFGRHHIHPTSGAPEGYPEIHLVHRGAGDKGAEAFFQARTSSVAWHSDVSYEQQPPGTTFLYILDKPETGGDTLFVNAAEAYNRLSPLFQERLHGLKATHSGVEQVNAAAARNSIKRRDPVINAHPIVRTHPATGEKALYINPQCEYLPLALVGRCRS
jgi:sulfonate dioxygenase